MIRIIFNRNKIRVLKAILPALVLLYFIPNALATHIRAGEITITASPSDPLFFTFTFIGYRDLGSQIEFGGGVFNFGDGNTIEGGFDITREQVADGEEIEKVIFKVSHLYQAPGRYTVSYEEEYRNADILNMDNSVSTTFYVETYFELDPFIGQNQYPVLTVPPIDFAAVGALFIHNPGATDQDGDSLAYRMVTPKQGRGMEVNNYQALNASKFYSNFSTGSEEGTEPTLNLDPVKGDLVWNAPGDAFVGNNIREYNVAFIIEEWRFMDGLGWILISYVTRDMQIIVESTDNERPELLVPDDICVEAGDTVNVIIQGDDPDGHPVKLEAFGGPFEVPSPARYTPDPPKFEPSPATLELEWETVCGHVRLRPYEVQFKVTDDPPQGPSLVDFETFQITVVGPDPTGLVTAVRPGKSMRLDWDPYSCPNADTMQIWRREGSFNLMMNDCVVGMPGNTGYELIDKIPIGNISYLDNNNGEGLAPGAVYCYRLVAQFSSPTGTAFSYVSEEACDTLVIDAPVITHADVLTTGENDGQIMVKWTPPYQLDAGAAPPPYSYDLFRGEGQEDSEEYIQVATKITDTMFVDTGLNTDGLPYNYLVLLYDASSNFVDSSAFASSVRLELSPVVQAIGLDWSASVPWSLFPEKYPYHYIYRDHVLANDPGALVLIDSVIVGGNGLTYFDNGAHNGEPLDEEIEYCYYVDTYGSYGNSLLPAPLINTSQRICAQPNDTIPPCRPPNLQLVNAQDCQTTVAELACGTDVYSNELDWEVDESDVCDDDIVFYNVYYSDSGEEDSYDLIGITIGTSFTHQNLTSLKGCYRITAVDRSGNESEFSEDICHDNCPVYLMPNVFTPNDDGKNDVFGPIHNNGLNIQGFDNSQCPRFVKSVKFTVFDRAGTQLYFYDSFENPNGIYINWDGKNSGGEDLPAGVYFYTADIVFDRLNPKDEKETLKGWVQILK